MGLEFKEAAEPVEVGDAVLVVDETYRKRVGLVTDVHGTFSGAYVPCLNVIYVTADETKKDPYGAQTERMSSLQHFGSGPSGMPKPGRFWANLA